MSKKKVEKKIARNYVAIILDRSGSMFGTKNQTVKGFNEQVQQIKLNAEDGIETFVSLVSFNGHVYEHLWNKPVDELLETNGDDYVPAGSTAMRDAIGYTVDKLMQTTDSENEGNAYLLIVISDGYENASGKYTPNALRELIDSCQKTKGWTFTYMGCDASYLQKMAEETHIPLSNMAAWKTGSAKGTVKAFRGAAASTGKYLRDRSYGYASTGDAKFATSSFYTEEVEASLDLTDDSDIDDSEVTEDAATSVTNNTANYLGAGTVVDWAAVEK